MEIHLGQLCQLYHQQVTQLAQLHIGGLHNKVVKMKDYVKYLGLMIDSNLSWKYHIKSICHKISKSIGIIAKIQHYVSRHILLSVYNSLIVPYLTYGICCWGNCALTLQRKIVTLQKRALRLIYFSKSKEHAIPFFLKSNCLITCDVCKGLGRNIGSESYLQCPYFSASLLLLIKVSADQ